MGKNISLFFLIFCLTRWDEKSRGRVWWGTSNRTSGWGAVGDRVQYGRLAIDLQFGLVHQISMKLSGNILEMKIIVQCPILPWNVDDLGHILSISAFIAISDM